MACGLKTPWLAARYESPPNRPDLGTEEITIVGLMAQFGIPGSRIVPTLPCWPRNLNLRPRQTLHTPDGMMAL